MWFFSTVSFDLFVLVSHCNLWTKEFCLTYVRPVIITYVGGVYLYLTLIGLQAASNVGVWSVGGVLVFLFEWRK